MTPDFDLLAKYYDLEHGEYRDDLDLYAGFARRTGSPVLEFGCGTGRVLLALAEDGHEVTGVDVSQAMLARAGQKLAARPDIAGRVRLVRADARDVDLPARFNLALWAINSFMHLATREDQLRALGQARRHLAAGGLLILDLFNPELELLLDADGRLLLDATWPRGEAGQPVLKLSSRRVDRATQRLDVTYIYDELLPDGRTCRTVAPFSMRYLHRFEAELLLERAGFAVEALYGTYELDEYTADCPRMVFVARKGST
jgi:SAM-dependent methyltransferase